MLQGMKFIYTNTSGYILFEFEFNRKKGAAAVCDGGSYSDEESSKSTDAVGVFHAPPLSGGDWI